MALNLIGTLVMVGVAAPPESVEQPLTNAPHTFSIDVIQLHWQNHLLCLRGQWMSVSVGSQSLSLATLIAPNSQHKQPVQHPKFTDKEKYTWDDEPGSKQSKKKKKRSVANSKHFDQFLEQAKIEDPSTRKQLKVLLLKEPMARIGDLEKLCSARVQVRSSPTILAVTLA